MIESIKSDLVFNTSNEEFGKVAGCWQLYYIIFRCETDIIVKVLDS